MIVYIIEVTLSQVNEKEKLLDAGSTNPQRIPFAKLGCCRRGFPVLLWQRHSGIGESRLILEAVVHCSNEVADDVRRFLARNGVVAAEVAVVAARNGIS